MLAEIHPLPAREVLSVQYNLEAGQVVDSAVYMIQGYSRIVGAIAFAAGGGVGAVPFTIFQGWQDNANPPGFVWWTHVTDVFNIFTGNNIPFNYLVRLKFMFWRINNTSGQPADLDLSVFLRNE